MTCCFENIGGLVVAVHLLRQNGEPMTSSRDDPYYDFASLALL